MTILKNKLAHARKIHELKQAQARVQEKIPLEAQNSPINSISTNDQLTSQENNSQKSSRKSSASLKSEGKKETCQNIVKNYSRAFTNFSLSSLALPHLKPELLKYDLSYDDFNTYIIKNKPKINCIKNLRGALFIKSNDNDKMKALKEVFQKMCQVFLKYYSVNWLFHSRIDNKMIHLNYRFKILRRVNNPEYFTYLEGYSN